MDHADQRLRGGKALSEEGHAAWYAAARMTDSTHYDPIAVGERALAEVPRDRARGARRRPAASTSTPPKAPSRSPSRSPTWRSTMGGGAARERLRTRITAAGLLTASAQDERSQHQNRRIARERLVRMIGEALRPRPPRRPTRPGRGAVERRLDEKRQAPTQARAAGARRRRVMRAGWA